MHLWFDLKIFRVEALEHYPAPEDEVDEGVGFRSGPWDVVDEPRQLNDRRPQAKATACMA